MILTLSTIISISLCFFLKKIQRIIYATIASVEKWKEDDPPYSILFKIFAIDIPEELSNEVEKAKDDIAVKQIGIEWAIKQSKELKEAKVPVLHYYTMGQSEATKAIASQVF